MNHRPLAFLVPTLLAGLISACAHQTATEDHGRADSGPTLYGQLGVSVDHTSID